MLADGAEAAPKRPKMVDARPGALALSGRAFCWAAAELMAVEGHAVLGVDGPCEPAATWGLADAPAPPKGLTFCAGCRPKGNEVDGVAAGSAGVPLLPLPWKVGILWRAACLSASIWAGVISFSSSAASASASGAATMLLGTWILVALCGRENGLGWTPCSPCSSSTRVSGHEVHQLTSPTEIG